MVFEREKIDSISYDCEKKISEFDKVPNDSYAYRIVKTDEYLDANDLVHIMNETLTKTEQIKISKKIKNLTFDSHHNFVDIEDDSDNISGIEEEETVDCFQLFVINVTSMAKGKKICNDSLEKVNTDQPSTLKAHDYDHVEVKDHDSDSDEDETTIPRVVVNQVYEETEKFKK